MNQKICLFTEFFGKFVPGGGIFAENLTNYNISLPFLTAILHHLPPSAN